MGLGSGAKAMIDEFAAKTPSVVDAVAGKVPKNFPSALLERVLDGLRRSADILTKARDE